MMANDRMVEVNRVKVSSAPVLQSHRLRAIRFWLGVVMAGLILSGVTAFPLETELHFFLVLLQSAPLRSFAELTHLLPWISRVHDALASTNRHYPFLAYGTDWLAFAHLVIAVAFIGPYRDPLRNKWVITFGLIACAGVIPLALIAGQVRGLPIVWRLIDCSFGTFGAIPLIFCRRHILEMERAEADAGSSH
jgi:hypothetical protein